MYKSGTTTGPADDRQHRILDIDKRVPLCPTHVVDPTAAYSSHNLTIYYEHLFMPFILILALLNVRVFNSFLIFKLLCSWVLLFFIFFSKEIQ